MQTHTSTHILSHLHLRTEKAHMLHLYLDFETHVLIWLCVPYTEHTSKGCRNVPCAEFVVLHFWFKWRPSGRGHWWLLIRQLLSQPVCHVGNGDRFVCHCLSDCRPPREWTYVFVFSFVCRRLHVCVCVRCTLASLGYPLQPVQETNKLHFNMRNINFLLDGKLIMAVEPPTPKPVQGTQCHCWEVKSATVTTSDQSTNRSGGIWFICPMSLAFCGFVKLNKKRYLSIQSMSMFQLCVEKIRKKVFSHCVELFFNSLH